MKFAPVACLPILTILAAFSYAGSVSNVTISELNINKAIGSMVFIKTSADPSTQQKISCHTDQYWNFVLPLASDADKSIYTALLTALATQSKVTLGGNGTCGSYSLIETLSSFSIVK
jgi:hypothetical protein